nr:MAG TPA: hypothetical protein [Caudoviricetes sp.]
MLSYFASFYTLVTNLRSYLFTVISSLMSW